ncbi:unnamed protein product [Candidula unifasciata]|uniref:G-protein coupled receptors family 1 profile domain-containing protein n=1 Tax=Candidula unifasciata TaxID=100452 RepID=A0A8S3ZKN2_9EUPU|nr:unnamed protein product [Candidula unifasciata]
MAGFLESVDNVSTGTVDGHINVERTSIFTDETYLYAMSISLGIVCQTVTIFGIISNVLNCIVFVRQGFSDCINISLLSLAISDLCSLLTVMWSNLCFTPAFQSSGIPLATHEVHLITGSWPHVMFTRVTGWITAFISLERCFCVIMPLKVRSIFTHGTHIIAVIVFFAVTFLCASMAYYSVGIGWRFFPERNRTMLGLIFLQDAKKRKKADSISYVINGVVMPVSCFIAVVVFTTILIVKLNQTANWRQSNAYASNDTKDKTKTTSNTKERKVAKMVVLISVTFITSFLPAVGAFMAKYIEPELTYDGLYRRLAMVILSGSFTAEALNSSINIFLYFKMSSKFRQTFMITFKLNRFVK